MRTWLLTGRSMLFYDPVSQLSFGHPQTKNKPLSKRSSPTSSNMYQGWTGHQEIMTSITVTKKKNTIHRSNYEWSHQKKKTSISFPCQSSADDDNNRVIFKETPCYLWALTWHQSPMSTSWGYGWHKPSNMGVIRMSEGNVSIGLILVEPMLEWTMTSHLAISRWQVQRSAPVLRQFSCFSAPVQHSPRSAHLWKYLL